MLKSLCIVLATSLLAITTAAVQAAPISGQGTWETTLKPRDINRDGLVDAYFDTVLNLTWLADWSAGLPGGFLAWAWAENLDVYGVTDWRLPSALNSDGTGPCSGNNCSDSEMGHLWYITLGNVAYDFDHPEGTGLTNTGPFSNMSTLHPIYFNLEGDPVYQGWAFEINLGRQVHIIHQQSGSVVAVREGDIPEPGSLALLALGLATLAFTRRGKP